MGSTWFRGGLEEVYASGDAWAADDIRASAVEGSSISTPSKTYLTLDDFLGPGSANNSLVGDEAVIPGVGARTFSWVGSPIEGYQFTFFNSFDFGVIPGGTQVAGVVYYANDRTTPASCPVWFCQENSGGPLTVPAGGATVSWGSSGSNIASQLLTQSINNRHTFWGTLDRIVEEPSVWADGSYNIGYALIQSGTPDREWRTMGDVVANYVTGAGPGDAGMPTSGSSDRLGPNFSGLVQEYRLQAVPPRTKITWTAATLAGAVGNNETVRAVVAFLYQGVYTSAARIITWDDVTDHPLQAAQDVTYVSDLGHIVNQINT